MSEVRHHVHYAGETAPEVPLKAVRMTDANMALGLAVRLFMADKALAQLPFGHWSPILWGQIQRNHYHFIVEGSEALGFLGWCLAKESDAERWLAGGELPFDKSYAGDCMIINAWIARGTRVNRFVLQEARHAGRNVKWVYFKRFYADGRNRPMKLAATKFISTHLDPEKSAPRSP